ncbi:phospholipid methyltransferase-domain-containing protein [Phakopsora pachyrhizi]|uniref:Phosphatidyl-N-methylethanolamine N-methyltransferase n=1 Tax=Phakopsora pachyrhizi TaxID=170000 RepID=A0AAV0BK45_PHAPC|nr:phospholipid methyltransferase-domain-containing protein [Phakopsora pachyrhizi]CAH7686689.1 phospholipid methyltransferase-domain-containing protein [Phakopsora pachyrhizi]
MRDSNFTSWLSQGVFDLIDTTKRSLWISMAWIIFNPLFWNVAARIEHSTRILTKLTGSSRRGCYFLGATIFLIGLLRDNAFKEALKDQPTHDLLDNSLTRLLAKLFFTTGSILVVSSMWALGVTGTYLGDYFGILMDHIVRGFPFNITSSPMYNGSSLCFLGTALSYKSPAGLILTSIVYVVYRIALSFEDPFTAKIYQARNSKSK